MRHILSPSAALFHADCRDALRQLPDNSIDSCVTDPPYALVSIVKRFGSPNAAPAKGNGAYKALSAGFMGKTWDTGETAFSTEFWAEVLRVLKPGAHVVAFGASRGYHRMACAIEDAGFEIRDSLCWIYATGFPKSHNISSHEKFCQCGAQSETERNLRCVSDDDVSSPEHAEPQRGEVLQSSVPQQNSHIKGAETTIRRNSTHDRIAQSVMEGWRDIPPPPWQLRASEICSMPAGIPADGAERRIRDGAPLGYGATLPPPPDTDGMRASSGSQAIAQRGSESRTVAGQPISQDGRAWENCGRCGKPMVPEGLGTALKPAFEPIVLARKPLSESTVAANVLRWRTGALNIDGCRVETDEDRRRNARGGENGLTGTGTFKIRERRAEEQPQTAGRWPANVVHDGSDEVIGAFPNTNGSKRGVKDPNGSMGYHGGASGLPGVVGGYDDAGGSAARFFYSAKASKQDRNGSKHPTVKPISLMEWLCTLITPPGGTVLDPFAGSGTTGIAAQNKGFQVVLCEREAEYVTDIKARFAGSSPASGSISLSCQAYG